MSTVNTISGIPADSFTQPQPGDVLTVVQQQSGGPSALAWAPAVPPQPGYKITTTSRVLTFDANTPVNANNEASLGRIVFNPQAARETAQADFVVLLELTNGSANGIFNIEIRIYDYGAPGTPITPTQVAAQNGLGTYNAPQYIKIITFPVTAPANLNEIYDTERIYEFRAVLLNSGAGDTADIFELGVEY